MNHAIQGLSSLSTSSTTAATPAAPRVPSSAEQAATPGTVSVAGVGTLSLASSAADASRVVQQASASDEGDLDKALSTIREHLQAMARDLEFTRDDTSGRTVVKVIARDSGEVIRQMPSEEALRLAEQLSEMRSGLVQDQA